MLTFTTQDWTNAAGTERAAEMCDALAAQEFADLKRAFERGADDEALKALALSFAGWRQDAARIRREIEAEARRVERDTMASLDAQEEAERRERAARNLANAEADLAALGVEFSMASDQTWSTVERAGRVLGTVKRPTRGETRWSFYTPDGAETFTTPTRFTMVRRLARHFA